MVNALMNDRGGSYQICGVAAVTLMVVAVAAAYLPNVTGCALRW